MTMNWDAVIAVAEVTGVVAVIASLIYVAAQIRQNTKIASATIVHETSVSCSRFHELLAADAELCDIYLRGIDSEKLSRVELLRFNSLIEMTMVYLEDIDHQWKTGFYFDEDDDIDLIEYVAPTYRALFSSRYFRDWWKHVGPDSTTPSLYIKISRIMAGWDAEDERSGD
jgi:hypothetical protein